MKTYTLKDDGKDAFPIGPVAKWVGFRAIDAGRAITVRVEDMRFNALVRRSAEARTR
jgi:hypothetical protein